MIDIKLFSALRSSYATCSIILIAILTIILTTCFNPLSDKGNMGRVTINLNNEARKVDDTTIKELKHFITLSGPDDPQERWLNKGETETDFWVVPGTWEITIQAWLGDELFATGTEIKNVIPGGDNSVTVQMILTNGISLSGSISIVPDTDVIIGTELTAVYTGWETVSYQWYKNGASVIGATGTNYTPLGEGNYQVTVSATGYISKISAAVAVTGGYTFEITVRVTAGSPWFRLPIHDNTVNDLFIDWGDGEIQYYTGVPFGDQGIIKTYGEAGDYTIRLKGHTYFTGSYTFTNGGALGFGFGFDDTTSDTYGELTNRQKVIGIEGNIYSLLGNFKPISNALLFYCTFFGCSNLTGSIPAELFKGISGPPAEGMFGSTFAGCSGLTGSIPASLFAGISGAPAEAMFNATFLNCSGLEGSIPSGLFGFLDGEPAELMFGLTFRGCSGLTGSIPLGLFGNLYGEPAEYMFHSTFSNCSGLEGNIPAGLFGNISGAPAYFMFDGTFYGCSGLIGNIPAGLFAGISGFPADSMFSFTFSNCSGLEGIQSGLFSGISGPPANEMFSHTFSGCSGLDGNIPTGLFAGITGVPARNMFCGTFSGCSGLTGIQAELFGNLINAPAVGMFVNTFSSCSGLTGQSASISGGQKLYNIFIGESESHVGGCYAGATGLDDYYYTIPFRWGGGS